MVKIVEFRFTPTEKFKWVREYEDGSTVLMGEYHPDMTYNCTKEPRHDALREQCKVWAEQGKIAVTPLTRLQEFITIADIDEDA